LRERQAQPLLEPATGSEPRAGGDANAVLDRADGKRTLYGYGSRSSSVA
jgi:hypothetical protein